MTEEFAAKYGPWAIVVGASDGVVSRFAVMGTVARRGS
jgi:hypothetical protein